jgi:hypothetical protein
MKTRYLIIFLLLLGTVIFAQTPEKFKYQAVIGNGSGEILANTTVALRISVLQDSDIGAVVYEEVFHPTTNPHGLVDLEIGNASFYSIDWAGHAHFLKIEVDPANGSAFTHLGTSPLLSVPYALHARTVEMDMVDDADPDPGNELQTINLNGSELTLSDGGGTVVLPSSGVGDNWGTQAVESDATLSGDGTGGSPLGVVGDLTDDQTLTLAGSNLSISDGNSVVLPPGADDWGAQVVESDATLSGNGTGGDLLSVVGDLTDDQTLSIAGNDLSISDGNSVVLPTGADDWGTQVVASDATLSGNGTSGDPLGVVGDLTDDQTLSISGNDLTISDGNTIPLPSSPWLRNASDIYYSSGNVGINTSSPTFDLHVYGNSMFNVGTGTIQISTPGSYPGFIGFENVTGNRRDIAFRPEGIGLHVSTSSSSPGINDAVWIREGGRLGIQTASTGPYPLLINERTSYGLAIGRETTSYLWEIYTSLSGDLVLLHGTTVVGSFDRTSGVYTPVSDRRMKSEIKPLYNSLSLLQKMRPATYRMKSSSGKREIGFVAQQLEELFPELVNILVDDKTGKEIYTVNHGGIAVVAVKAIQEQQEIIDSQAETIEQLSDRLEDLERRFGSMQRGQRGLR